MSRISVRDPDPAGWVGSLPEKFVRRREPGEGDDVPEPRPEPPLTASVPDIAFQIRDPRASGPDCLDALEGSLADGVQEVLAEEYPDAYPLADCVRHGDRSATTVAVWTVPGTTDRVRQARELGFREVDLLEDNEKIGIFVSASFIRRRVAGEYEKAAKRYNASGNPDPDGPIHITGHVVRFTAPDRVSLDIRGYDERPWPDVSFTITVIDTLESGAGRITCETAEPALDADPSWVNVATIIATALVAAYSPLFLAIKGVRDILGPLNPFGDQPVPSIAGPGCAIALTFFQDEVPIPGGQKLLIFYDARPVVTSGGMFGSGSYVPTAREPRLSILGPERLVADAGRPGGVRASYRLTGADLRGDLSIQWSPSGGMASTPTEAATNVGWFVPSGDAGDVVQRSLSARVTDADGLTASARLGVAIHLIAPGDDELSICDKRPWQCEE